LGLLRLGSALQQGADVDAGEIADGQNRQQADHTETAGLAANATPAATFANFYIAASSNAS
jgi:hypothetical protein